MKNYFIGCTHFQHSNIIRYCNRPFLKEGDLDSEGKWVSLDIAKQRTDEMDKLMISNWNSRIKPEDNVIILGDFMLSTSVTRLSKGEGGLKPASYYRDILNGNKILIKGNHDSDSTYKTCIRSMKVKLGGFTINLVHSPMHLSYKVPINIHAHVHGAWDIKRCYSGRKSTVAINVSADVTNFMPQTIEEVLKRYQRFLKDEKLKKNDKSKTI
jgi:calcineurin-like phosphoesterase family protein